MFQLIKNIEYEPSNQHGYFKTLEQAVQAASIINGSNVDFKQINENTWDEPCKRERFSIFKIQTWDSIEEFKKEFFKNIPKY